MLFAGSVNFIPILVGYIYISIDTIFINMSIFDVLRDMLIMVLL